MYQYLLKNSETIQKVFPINEKKGEMEYHKPSQIIKEYCPFVIHIIGFIRNSMSIVHQKRICKTLNQVEKVFSSSLNTPRSDSKNFIITIERKCEILLGSIKFY